MKTKLNIWLMATLVFGFGMTFVSCSDDDDESIEERREREAQQKASKFWNVVGQLVSVDDATEDYEGKTFEATYGMPDPTNATTRIVNTNDMQTAAQRFANLVDAKGINENTASYTWSDPEIGSMTYTRGGTPAEWATVDVDIYAVPGLQRIIYRAGGEGDNGKFKGRAYYRFGDVVSRTVQAASDPKKTKDDRGNDNGGQITEYWICVRPAFGPEGKEDSHWVCVNTVTDKNYKYYKSSTNTDYWLPTALKTDKENMQNFAELLYAISNPDIWYDNADKKHKDGMLWGFSGVPIFTDFTRKNLELHNQNFWKNVQEAWKKKQVVQKALNLTDIESLKNVVNDGLHLLHKGYSWWFTTSWDCELWEAVYSNGTKDEELNMHHAEYNNPEKDMKNVNFDVREMGNTILNYNSYFDKDRKTRWAIRHATGKELASDKKYDVKKPINGVKEEYRYYGDVFYDTYLNADPETTASTPTQAENVSMNGGTYMIGDVLEDEEGSRWFCILGSPHSDFYKKVKDNRAMFISFDNIKIVENVATNIIKEDDVMEVAVRMAMAYTHLTSVHQSTGARLTTTDLGKSGEQIMNYTGVDLRKLFINRDSVWCFQNYNDKKWYDSKSTSGFFNLAYYNGSDRQAIARVIADKTQAGNERTACKGETESIESWNYRVYKHYEVYDPSRMGGPTPNERSVGMTLWQSPWANTGETMYLDDVANQQKINQYAAADKWVRLPQKTFGVTVPGGPRTKAESSARPEDYLWKKTDFATNKTSIFNEPVLFMRVMYIEDNGSKTPNLTSTDGRKLKIVQLLDDSSLYGNNFQGQWALPVYDLVNKIHAIWYDNTHHTGLFQNWPSLTE